jgi:hypothetical protein
MYHWCAMSAADNEKAWARASVKSLLGHVYTGAPRDAERPDRRTADPPEAREKRKQQRTATGKAEQGKEAGRGTAESTREGQKQGKWANQTEAKRGKHRAQAQEAKHTDTPHSKPRPQNELTAHGPRDGATHRHPALDGCARARAIATPLPRPARARTPSGTARWQWRCGASWTWPRGGPCCAWRCGSCAPQRRQLVARSGPWLPWPRWTPWSGAAAACGSPRAPAGVERTLARRRACAPSAQASLLTSWTLSSCHIHVRAARDADVGAVASLAAARFWTTLRDFVSDWPRPPVGWAPQPDAPCLFALPDGSWAVLVPPDAAVHTAGRACPVTCPLASRVPVLVFSCLCVEIVTAGEGGGGGPSEPVCCCACEFPALSFVSPVRPFPRLRSPPFVPFPVSFPPCSSCVRGGGCWGWMALP